MLYGRSFVVAASLALALCAGGLVSCSSLGAGQPKTAAAAGAVAPVEPPKLTDTAPREYAGLHNVVAYHEGFYSGSAPEGDAGFDTIAGMGVKTIISVDGAAPEVEYARTRGIRYIHLPIGYNGFDDERKLEIARATRDAVAQGPVYVHCHHGMHRSAGAAASAAASLGWLTPDEAVARMKVSGTAPNYKGLYACAAASAALSTDVVDHVPASFPETAPPQGFVKAMVEIDEISEWLKAVEAAAWRTPVDHPDLVPVAEAGRMADILRDLANGDRARAKPDGYAKGLRDCGAIAQGIEDMLASGQPDAASLSSRFKALGASCKDCHAKYRD